MTSSITNIYLFFYNSGMAIGWLFLFSYLIMNLHIPNDLSKIEEFNVEKHIISESVFYCCILQCIATLEVFHVLFGLVKGSLFATIAQVLGRNHILFACIYCIPELWIHPCVGWLFIFWSSIEIVRYPTYALGIYSLPLSGLFAWLRYTIFIPLYPLGFSTERKYYYFLFIIILY